MPGRRQKKFSRFFFFTLFSLFTLTAWWMGDAFHSTDLTPAGKKLLKEEEKKALGTLTTLLYSLQFYLYGEKSLPPSIETLIASVYSPLSFQDFQNSYHHRQAHFYSYLQLVPTFSIAGDFSLTLEAGKGLKLSVFLPDSSSSPPSAFSVSFLLPLEAVEELFHRYDLTPEPLWSIRALSVEEQRLYWQCQHLFVAGQLLAYQTFPPEKDSPGAPSHFSDFRKYPFLMNFHFTNVFTGKPLQEVPPTKPFPGDISMVVKTLKVQRGENLPEEEKKFPVFICYKKDGTPVNPETLKFFEITPENSSPGNSPRRRSPPLP